MIGGTAAMVPVVSSGGELTVVPLDSGGTSSLDSDSYNGGEEVSRYIDSSDTVSEDSDTRKSGSDHEDFSPPPLVKTIAFDWSTLTFDYLQYSNHNLADVNESDVLEEDDEGKTPKARQLIENYGAMTLQNRSDAMQNLVNLKQNATLLRDTKALFRNCKRKIIKSGRHLKDRSHSVDSCSSASNSKISIFRNQSADQTRDDSCTRLSDIPNIGKEISRSEGNTGSAPSLPSRTKLRTKLGNSATWVAGVRRRDSIGLLTQPMLSAIRGAGQKVKHRARSVSKVSVIKMSYINHLCSYLIQC